MNSTNQAATTNTTNSIDYMVFIFIAIGIIIFFIIIGILFGIIAPRTKYFENTSASDEQYLKVKFYIRKHTIFRYFSILYSIIHHVLNILSIVATMITIYIVLDSSSSMNVEIIFLLLSAISTSVVSGMRFDKVAEAYAQAMRILESAILQYLSNNIDMAKLITIFI